MNGDLMMTRKEQKEKRYQEILSVALDIFIRKGYNAAKIQDIAGAAGMSIGLLFHYFESKEKLYEELIKIGRTHPRTILDGIEGEPLDFFRTVVRDIVQYVNKKPFTAKMFVLMAQAKCNEAAPESVKKILARNDSLDLSVEKIKKGQQNGTIKKGNPVALALTFWGALQGIAEQMAVNPDFPVPDNEWIVDIIRKK
jgi:AcrR family transcriptional regulator